MASRKKREAPLPSTKLKEDSSSLTELKILISFCTGVKGGVGKSTLARLLYQFHLDRDIPVIGVEANPKTPDFSGMYAEIKQAGNIVTFSKAEEEIRNVNLIYNLAGSQRKNIVVNCPANFEDEFAFWLESFNILETTSKNNIGLVNWFACSGEYDSIQPLKVALKRFAAKIPYVIVKNKKFKEWELFDRDTELQELITQYQCKVIEIPGLNAAVTGEILSNRLTYEKAKTYTSENFDFAEQGAVEGFLNRSYVAFESTGYFQIPQVNQ